MPSLQIDLIDIPFYEDALIEWNRLCPDTDFPTKPSIQHEWDNINIKRIVDNVDFVSDIDVARYKASVIKESSAWLTTLPSKTIGTHLDNNVFRISVALRLGGKICFPHICPCGYKVDDTGIHGLSCSRSIGRWSRHSCINDIIKRALGSAKIPATLEPPGLSRDDGKRPDGMSLITWKNGQSLVWDATCRDTLAPSYRNLSSRSAGLVAKAAATDKKNHYKKLISDNFFFVPFAVETMGPWCEEAKELISSIGKLICAITGDSKSTNYLVQRISIEIQRHNAACVMGSLPITSTMDEIYFVL